MTTTFTNNQTNGIVDNIQVVPVVPVDDWAESQWSPLIIENNVEDMVVEERERWARDDAMLEAEANSPENMAKRHVENECNRIKNNLKIASGIGGIPARLFDNNSSTLSMALNSKRCFICQDVLRNPKWCIHCWQYFCSSCINKALESRGQCCFGQIGRGAKCEIRNAQGVVSDFMEILKIECVTCKEAVKYTDYDKHISVCSDWCLNCGLWQNARDHNCVDDFKTFLEVIKESYRHSETQLQYLDLKNKQLQRENVNLRAEVENLMRDTQRTVTRTVIAPSTNTRDHIRNNSSVRTENRNHNIELAANDLFDRGSLEQRTSGTNVIIEVRYGTLTKRINNISRETTWNALRQRICDEFNLNPMEHDLLDVQYRIRMGRRTVAGELFYPHHRLNLVPRLNLRQQQNFLLNPTQHLGEMSWSMPKLFGGYGLCHSTVYNRD